MIQKTFTASLLATPSSFAHGNIELKIQNKTIEISKNKKNTTLYFERGYLYEQHTDFIKALKNYLKSKNLDYITIHKLFYRKANTHYLWGKFKKTHNAAYLFKVNRLSKCNMALQQEKFL